MVQQTKKIPPPVSPKNMEQLLDIYESANPFPNILTSREEIMKVVVKVYGPPPKPQKPEKLQSSRIDRLKSKIDEIAKFNFIQCYYPQLSSTQFQYMPPDSDNEEDGYDKVENECQPEIYNELLPKLSPAICKMYLSRKAQEEKSKKDEWFSSLQYLNASINDLPISKSFLNNESEFDGFNLATAEELDGNKVPVVKDPPKEE
ncbi:hypothetical protein C1646_767343 [Rhizophagus diaphanus]|nr:hypothetical protein C1646_767343 [Rhizophagus diaphanus] [Rhizophagus sp. MUCL 43196]